MDVCIQTDPQFAARIQTLAPLGTASEPRSIKAVRLDQLPATSRLGELAATWLSREEQHLFARFSREKRKREWLAGRLAAKLALLDWEGSPAGRQAVFWHRWAVLPEPSGRPKAKPAGKEKIVPGLSISHSAGLAVALVAANSCGIDIQQVSPTASRAQERFSTPGEQEVLLALEEDETRRCTLLWSAKEALRKSLVIEPLAGFRELELTSLTTSPPGRHALFFSFHRSSSPLEVTAFFHDDYACCLTGTGTHARKLT